jgi:hypothetical protein
MVGGLFIGYEPTGGDPDRLYRPIKGEYARALRAGRLPLWSDRFGLGTPLVAESHVAAFYPINLALYRWIDVNAAYRIAMWLHYVALAAFTYAYARTLAVSPWGSALSAISFAFCGFQAIHASHEPFYLALPYLPLALIAAERFMAGGSMAWLPGLSLVWGAQLTLGHFQIQAWTAILVLITGVWRLVERRRGWWRLVGLTGALALGAAVAAAQLAPSAELAAFMRAERSTNEELARFSYVPMHWGELFVPRLFTGLEQGPEGPYWTFVATTGYEACFYVGTIPLLMACVGLAASRGEKGTAPWRLLIVPLSLALAMLPFWGAILIAHLWPRAYLALLHVPGLGLFRAPARYIALASFGICLLAGRGFDRAASESAFRLGVALACALAVVASAWSHHWVGESAALRSALGPFGLEWRLGEAALVWAFSLAVIWWWRRGRLASLVALLVAACELGVLYYNASTKWGWTVRLPEASPILSKLAAEGSRVGRVAGMLDNLPIRAGTTALYPYLGVRLPPLDRLIRPANSRGWSDDPIAAHWLRRFGTTHGIWDRVVVYPGAEVRYRGPDSALDRLAYRPLGTAKRATWTLVRYPLAAFPPARIARFAFDVPDRATLIEQLTARESPDEVFFLATDMPQPREDSRARTARLLAWDGQDARVEHDGPCDLVVSRTFYPGWAARMADGRALTLYRADGGSQAVRIPGAGVTEVKLRYEPASYALGLRISGAALTFAVVALGACAFARLKRA